MKLLKQMRMAFKRGRVDRDIRRELDFHVRMETEKRMGSGLSETEAHRSALRDFGGVERIREEVRDARGMTTWDSLVQDVRFGLRTLRHAPAYTAAAILILGLGIGANTAMFSVINGVLLKPLPFRDGQELVLIQQSAPQSNVAATGVSIPELYGYRERIRSIRDLVEYHSMSFILLNQGEPDRVDTGVVSANYFEMLGVAPLHGRTFVTADEQLGAEAVLVLGYQYWQQKFGADPGVVGKVLKMNDRAHTIVGVLPNYPQYPRANDVYMPTSACPFRANAQRALPQGGFRSFSGLRVFGRLAPGMTEDDASREAASLAASFSQDHPADYTRAKGFTARAASLREQLIANAQPTLYALAGTTLLVLILACANVANLALARTMQRRRELAVRAALGAGRRRLLRQLVTESLLVSLAGGALGLGFAWLSLDMLVRFVGRFTARTGQISIDSGVLWFTLGVSVLTGIIFGAAPALASRRNVADAMRDGAAQAGDAAGRRRLRAGLVVAQVAVSFVLLVGAALLTQSVYRLASVTLGYQTDQTVTATLAGGFFVPPDKTIRDNFAILERLRASPGVAAAALTSAVPLTALNPVPQPVKIEGVRDDGVRSFAALGNVTSSGYFDALQVPLLAGRDFRSSDDAKAPPVAVVNQSMAQLWGGANPLGGRFQPDGSDEWLTVVGVVPDFRQFGADRDIAAQYYWPFTQGTFGGYAGGRVLVRTDGDPGTLASTIKAAVHDVDPDMAVKDFKTLADLKDGRLAAPRLTAALLAIFAGVALIVTLAGLTGVMATAVSQRTREFGLRMALGAGRPSVLWLVLSQALLLIAVGLTLGLGGAYAFGRALRGFLFATAPNEPLVYLTMGALFLAFGAFACYLPARRATSIDPLSALRTE